MVNTGLLLTKEQKNEIVQFCEQHQDLEFERIAEHFTTKFGKKLDRPTVYSTYMDGLIR